MSKTYSKWRPHPWHGLTPGPLPPSQLHVFVEITPFDIVKYEVDKESGYLKVDRSQRTSSLPPALYGFIPQTYAGPRVADLMHGVKTGDNDPLDICVLSERPISRAEVIVNAIVVGGIPMDDGGQADDKIVGILRDDPVFGDIREIEEVPDILVGRLMHYFSTYKLRPANAESVRVGEPYGREHAEAVVSASILDYRDEFVESAAPRFTEAARRIWEAMPGKHRDAIITNVWCATCSDETEIVNMSGRVEQRNLVLEGDCAACGGTVARVVEGP